MSFRSPFFKESPTASTRLNVNATEFRPRGSLTSPNPASPGSLVAGVVNSNGIYANDAPMLNGTHADSLDIVDYLEKLRIDDSQYLTEMDHLSAKLLEHQSPPLIRNGSGSSNRAGTLSRAVLLQLSSELCQACVEEPNRAVIAARVTNTLSSRLRQARALQSGQTLEQCLINHMAGEVTRATDLITKATQDNLQPVQQKAISLCNLLPILYTNLINRDPSLISGFINIIRTILSPTDNLASSQVFEALEVLGTHTALLVELYYGCTWERAGGGAPAPPPLSPLQTDIELLYGQVRELVVLRRLTEPREIAQAIDVLEKRAEESGKQMCQNLVRLNSSAGATSEPDFEDDEVCEEFEKFLAETGQS